MKKQRSTGLFEKTYRFGQAGLLSQVVIIRSGRPYRTTRAGSIATSSAEQRAEKGGAAGRAHFRPGGRAITRISATYLPLRTRALPAAPFNPLDAPLFFPSANDEPVKGYVRERTFDAIFFPINHSLMSCRGKKNPCDEGMNTL